jgi:hypothetical protein
MPVTPLVEFKASSAAEALVEIRDEAAYQRYQKHWEKIDPDVREPYDDGFDAGVAAMRDCRTCLNHFETPKFCRSTKPCVEGDQWKYYRVEPIWAKKQVNSPIQSVLAQEYGHLGFDSLGEVIGDRKP